MEILKHLYHLMGTNAVVTTPTYDTVIYTKFDDTYFFINCVTIILIFVFVIWNWRYREYSTSYERKIRQCGLQEAQEYTSKQDKYSSNDTQYITISMFNTAGIVGLGFLVLFIPVFIAACYGVCILGFGIYYLLNFKEINNKIVKFLRTLKPKKKKRKLTKKEKYKQHLINNFKS